MRRREFIGAITATAAVGVLSAGADEPKGRTSLNRPKETRREDRLNR
jgi:hypothetical protein